MRHREIKVKTDVHLVQGTRDTFLHGNETCPMYHLKHRLCVPADPPSPLPTLLSAPEADPYGSVRCLLWVPVELGQQDTRGNVSGSENGVYSPQPPPWGGSVHPHSRLSPSTQGQGSCPAPLHTPAVLRHISSHLGEVSAPSLLADGCDSSWLPSASSVSLHLSFPGTCNQSLEQLPTQRPPWRMSSVSSQEPQVRP